MICKKTLISLSENNKNFFLKPIEEFIKKIKILFFFNEKIQKSNKKKNKIKKSQRIIFLFKKKEKK